MSRQPYIVAIMLFATINGIFSPLVVALLPFVVILSPAFLTDSIAVIFFVSSLLLSTLTLIVGGVPAALYERWIGAKEIDRIVHVDLARRGGLAVAPGRFQFLSVPALGHF